MFYDAHERLDTAQMVGALAAGGRLEFAELHQLVAKAVALVEQPQLLTIEIGRLNVLFLVERAVLRHVSVVLFVEKRLTRHLFQSIYPC